MPSTQVITLRTVKGSALLHAEVDANFTNLKERLDTEAVSYCGTATGTGAAYTITTLNDSLTAPSITGKIFTFTATPVNTGACTLTLKKSDGSTTLITGNILKYGLALAAGAIPASSVVCVVFNGTNFELLNDNGVSPLELEQPLSVGSIAWDFTAKPVTFLSLTGAATFNSCSGLVGQYASVRIKQDGTGNRTVSFTTSAFKGTTDFSLSTGANQVDWLLFRIASAGVAELVGFRNDVGA
jgi:hypothetical protein